MQDEVVTIAVAGTPFTGWLSLNLRGSVRDAARSFQLELPGDLDGADETSLFQDQAPVTIMAGNDLLFSGYVFDLVPQMAAEEAKITVTGRSKGADAIDCSADHTKPDYVNKTLLDIAKDQDAFGIGFTTDVTFEQIDRFRFNPGESLFRGLEILCRDQACTMAGQPDGGIKLTRAGVNPPRQGGALTQGINIKIGSSSHNSANRHSEIHVHGQAYKGVGKPYTQITAVAKDGSVGRYRPAHALHRGHATRSRIKTHAGHRRDKEAGEGLTAVITTPGWRDETGRIWTPGHKVWTESPFLRLSQDMLIETVDYLKDGKQGPRAVLSLVDPRAHGGQGGGVNKSGPGWNFDNGTAD